MVYVEKKFSINLYVWEVYIYWNVECIKFKSLCIIIKWDFKIIFIYGNIKLIII